MVSQHSDCPRTRRALFYVNGAVVLTMALSLVFSLMQGSLFVISGSLAEIPSLSTTTTTATTTTNNQSVMTDSTNATVMGFATNFLKSDYQKFVGSLRKVGFKGHIILAVQKDIRPEIQAYLDSRKVMVKKLDYEPCTHTLGKDKENKNEHDVEVKTCVSPYPLLKQRWGRFPKLRDFLLDCKTCTGPVLVTDVRDTYFQRDPFGDGQPTVEGLQVFQEHKSINTQHWLVEWPVRECKGVTFTHPMLCSGTTIGTRSAMLEYLNIMHQEMMVWMADPKCHFDTNGDDQSMHNYLYWTGKLPFAKDIPNRMGLVHTVGAQGSILWARQEQFERDAKERNLPPDLVDAYAPMRTVWFRQVEDAEDPKNKQWLRPEYDLTDEQGFFINYDGSRSSIVHQYDRFGPPFDTWLNEWSGLVDGNY